MDERELVARRVAAACAELLEEASSVKLDFLARLLAMTVLEATKHASPPMAPEE